METFGLRRTQSLRSLSGTQEMSWVMTSAGNWTRKSVSQLVQHYQSCADLRSSEKEEQGYEDSETCVNGHWKVLDNRETMRFWSNLSKSRSMEFIPQREISGTRALRTLFESKATLQQDYHSSPRLNSLSTGGSKSVRDCPLQDGRSYNAPLKETTIQRTTQVDGQKAINGLPEGYNRLSRHTHDDKYNSSLSKGGTSTGQTRDRISTSSSVKDKLALYLSRTVAIESVGGSNQPQESKGTPRTRAKTSKFQPPAKEMCSACLTPVYPVERMVVNKLVLHHNCFCCKHCKKKLSTHNYSSVYGEFYCISHYQQLFKRKGNYDEGFGRTQHKDRWLHKDKGTDEPDARTTPRITKNNLNTSVDVFSAKGSLTDHGLMSAADVKGKLKIRWPPEKNITRLNPTQPASAPVLKNNMDDTVKHATVGVSERWRGDKPDYRREMINKGGKGQSEMTRLISVEKLPSEKPLSVKDPTKVTHFQITNSPMECKDPLPNYMKHQTPVQTRRMPPSKLNSGQVSNKQEASSSKVRKSVRFSQKVDVALCDQSSQISSGAENENLSDQFEQSLTKDATEINDMNVDPLSNSLKESNGNLDMTKCQDNGDPPTGPNQEPDADMESRQEIPHMNTVTLTEDVKVNDSLEFQSHTEISSLTEDNTKHESSERPDVVSKDPVSKYDSAELSSPQNLVGHVTGEEVDLKMNENQVATTRSNNDKENSVNKKNGLARTNSKTKLGSWSKGRNPLTKFFPSSGNDKATRAEPKDAKKADIKSSGGLLGRLFQSSSDATKTPEPQEKNTKMRTVDDKAETEQETKTEENQENENMSEVAPLEPDAANQTNLQLSEETNSTSIEPVSSLKKSIKETSEDLKTPEKTNENPAVQESELQISAATDAAAGDPEKQSEVLPSDMHLLSPVYEESVIELTPKQSSDDSSTHPVFDDNFGDVMSSAQVAEAPIKINTDESSTNSTKMTGAPDEMGVNLISEALLSPSNENPQNHTNFFDMSDSSSLAGSSFLTASVETAAMFPDDFSLIDTQLLSAENKASLVIANPPTICDLAPVKQDDNPDPFSAVNQTSEQIADLDIFSSNNSLFSQPILFNVSDQNGAEAHANQFSAFTDDIFGDSHISDSVDVFKMQPNNPDVSNSRNDLLTSDTSSTVATSTQIDLFAEDIFVSDAQLFPVAEPSNADVFGDSLLVSEGISTEQKSESSRWMDDLLG